VESGEKVSMSVEGRRKTPKPEELNISVLFTGFSKGGSLQKCLREVVDRLDPMMGFNKRVVEREGTGLGALLSNKNLWSGAHCVRGVYRKYRQPGDRNEDCKSRIVVYESVYTRSNTPKESKEEAKAGVLRSGEPSLYVGTVVLSIRG
jgi:hypothetical protein